jgi:hypothetical protein
MSAMGQKRTSRRARAMSALPPKADIGTGPVISFDAPAPALRAIFAAILRGPSIARSPVRSSGRWGARPPLHRAHWRPFLSQDWEDDGAPRNAETPAEPSGDGRPRRGLCRPGHALPARRGATRSDMIPVAWPIPATHPAKAAGVLPLSRRGPATTRVSAAYLLLAIWNRVRHRDLCPRGRAAGADRAALAVRSGGHQFSRLMLNG